MLNLDGKLMGLMNWVTRFLYLQIIWILFCLIGLVVGGVFPATFAMFGVARKWIREHTDDPLFKTFLRLYKESFVKANILGWWMLLLGFSLYYYFELVSNSPGMISIVLMAIIILIGFIFLVTALFIIPVYVHFDVRLLIVFKHAAITALSHPLHTLAMVATLIVFWYLILFLPVIFIFIGVSLLTFILMIIANGAFNNIERKLNA